MSEYHKIQTFWKRESEKPCDMLVGQYATAEFEMLRDLRWLWEEKVDGTNIRVIYDGQGRQLGGKTDRAQIPATLIGRLDGLFPSSCETLRKTFGDAPATLYGEGFGARIQKGGGNYNPDGVDFCLFDVRCGGLWLQRHDVRDVARKLNIAHVPEVGEGTLQELNDFVADGFKSEWGDFEAEGVVARPQLELQDRRGNRIITKLKTKDFRKLERRPNPERLPER